MQGQRVSANIDGNQSSEDFRSLNLLGIFSNFIMKPTQTSSKQ